jgi:hypothetical protein
MRRHIVNPMSASRPYKDRAGLSGGVASSHRAPSNGIPARIITAEFPSLCRPLRGFG